MSQAPERTVIINGSGGERGGGVGMGMVLGGILAIALIVGLLWFFLGAKILGTELTLPPVNINPTINIAPPEIKIPENITISTPVTAPAVVPNP